MLVYQLLHMKSDHLEKMHPFIRGESGTLQSAVALPILNGKRDAQSLSCL